MRMRGFIPVDRKNRESAIQSVEQAVASLKGGRPLLAFPEGTRSPDGRLQPFKKGVFVMAIKAGVPVVPITVSGSSKIMAKGELAIHPGTVRVSIHDAIPTKGLTVDDREELVRQVHTAILSPLTAEERPPESAHSDSHAASGVVA